MKSDFHHDSGAACPRPKFGVDRSGCTKHICTPDSFPETHANSISEYRS